MRLDVKKQKAKNGWFFLSISCSKQCKFLGGSNASSKVRPNYLEVLKHQESYGWCFWMLTDIEKATKHESLGCKTLS